MVHAALLNEGEISRQVGYNAEVETMNIWRRNRALGSSFEPCLKAFLYQSWDNFQCIQTVTR